MNTTLKKILPLAMAAFLAGGCAAKNAPDPSPAPTGTPTPLPTEAPWTPEPTITPRTFDVDVEMPAAGATPLLIHPIDEPTRPPLTFNFTQYVSQQLGIQFNVPASWKPSSIEGSSNALVFTEPESEANEGFASSMTIVVNSYSSLQTLDDARAELDSVITQIRESYPQLEVSSKAENRMLGEAGAYVTYWINMPMDENGTTLRTRGRILVVPRNRKLYQVRYICPAAYNADYENVYREFRTSVEAL